MPKKRASIKSSTRKRLRVLKLHALNIVVNPHPKGRYIELFQGAMEGKLVFAFHGKRTGFLTNFKKAEGDIALYRGMLALFTDIDIARKWLDFGTGEEASPEDVSKISIPSNLKPEYTTIPFIFDPIRHRMLFASNGLGVSSAKKLMSGLLGAQELLGSDDQLEVTVIQDAANLDKMLNESHIVELTIEINLPNADSLIDAEGAFHERLIEMRAKRQTEIFAADKGKSLIPDEAAKIKAKMALNNGEVKTKVKTPMGSEERSTLNFPKTEKVTFDPDTTNELEVLLSKYAKFFGS